MSKVALERPDLFKKTPLRPSALGLGSAVLKLGHAANGHTYAPNIAIIIRTKNDAAALQDMLGHVTRLRADYAGRVDVIVVDTESRDNTAAIATDFGATVVTITQADFSYPKGINLGLAQVKKDVVLAFITVGHALPALSNCIPAGVRHFADTHVVGAYGFIVPHDNASMSERFFFTKKTRLTVGAHKLIERKMGAMGATNCMVRMSTWRKHPFDEAYAGGGEDTAWAAAVLERDEEIVFEPAMTVHHSHGLRPINLFKQRVHWGEVAFKPTKFDTKKIAKRRPDLFK